MLHISVIMPVFNAAAFLEKAVESALQFQEVQEILLIEDCSTDDSFTVCEKLSRENPRVKLFQHPDKGNHGAGASRNLGLEKASQEFVAFLDADDYYLPNRFDAEKELFKNEKTEGVFGAIGTEFLTEKGKQEFLAKFKNTNLTTVNYAAEGEEVFKGLLGITERVFGSFFTLDALTIRNESIKKNKLRFNENLRVHQDSDFIIKLSYACHLKSGIIDKAVAIRGVHDDNRITKIVKYSQKFNENQYLLRLSLYTWATEQRIEKKILQIFQLYYLTFFIAKSRGLAKYMLLIWAIFKNPKILKTRYRYYYLQKNS